MEGAKIYAQNAIRAKTQSLNYLKLAARMDAVAARVQTAIDMKLLAKDMKNVTKSMDSIMSKFFTYTFFPPCGLFGVVLLVLLKSNENHLSLSAFSK